MLLPLQPVVAVLVAVFGGLFALVGLAFVVAGARRLRLGYRLWRTTPTPVMDLPNVTGRVEVVGTAHRHEAVVEAPFSGAECLVCEWRVREEHTDSDGDTDWRTIAHGRASVPFLLDDGSGRVLVDPAAAARYLSTGTMARVDGGDPAPERIQRFIDADPDVDDENTGVDIGPLRLSTGRDRRYEEARLDPGEPVHCYGTVTYDATWGRRGGEVNARLDGAAGLLDISDTDDAGAHRRHLLAGVGYLVFGGFMVGITLLVAAPILLATLL